MEEEGRSGIVQREGEVEQQVRQSLRQPCEEPRRECRPTEGSLVGLEGPGSILPPCSAIRCGPPERGISTGEVAEEKRAQEELAGGGGLSTALPMAGREDFPPRGI